MRVAVALLPCIMIFSLISVWRTFIICDYNTKALNYEDSKKEVGYIDSEDNVYLQDGSKITSSDIISYVKISYGKGTWYIEDSKLFVVSLTMKDLIKLLSPCVLCIICMEVALITKSGTLDNRAQNRLYRVCVAVGCFALLFALWVYAL